MGGPARIDLSSHKRDDWHYNRKRRQLRKYLPEVTKHLDHLRSNGAAETTEYNILKDFAHHLTASSSVRAPIHVLLRGEEVFRREVLRQHEANATLMDAMWQLPTFREGVTKKLEAAVAEYGCIIVDKSPAEMEEFIFSRAKTQTEYLENAARIIVFMKNKAERRKSHHCHPKRRKLDVCFCKSQCNNDDVGLVGKICPKDPTNEDCELRLSQESC